MADLRRALRGIARAPGFSFVAILSLAIGLGATITVFSLVNAIHLRPLDFARADRLVDLHETSATELCEGCAVGMSWDGFVDWQQRATSFTGIGAYLEQPFAVTISSIPERVSGAVVTWNLWSILGVSPARGRGFLPEEDRIGGDPVVMIGESLWKSRFAHDELLVGRQILVNGVSRTVVGIMPGDFAYPERSSLWIPAGQVARGGDRSTRDYGVVARLKDGVALARANAEMSGIGRQLAAEHPADEKGWSAEASLLRDDMTRDVGPSFTVLLLSVMLVLLITCANLAGMLLARATSREREMAVRVAIGANRQALIRQLLVESFVLALFGGAAGLLLSAWGIDLVRSWMTASVPYWIHFGIDARVVAFAVAITAVTAGVFGLLPALRASRPNVQSALKEGAQQSGSARARIRSLLVVAQLSLSLVLLTASGLLGRTFMRLNRPSEGFNSANLLLADLSLSDARYDDNAKVVRVAQDIQHRLSAIPGISAAVLHTHFLAGFGAHDRAIDVEGVPEVPRDASPRFMYAVSPGYVRAQGLRLIAGRDIAETDRANGEAVALVNEAMATRLWPQGALGHRIRLGEREPGHPRPWSTIVGIVSNVDGPSRPGQPAAPYAYVPISQEPARPLQLLVRTAGDPSAMVSTLRAALAEVAPDQPLENPRTADADRAERFWPYRFFATVMSCFALFALLLSALGVYGTISHAVARRTREFGVRMALGAAQGQVLGLVARWGFGLAAAGLVVGVVASLALGPVVRGMLFGASAFDPLVLITVSLVLLATSLAATLIPARRATRVNPVDALRSE